MKSHGVNVEIKIILDEKTLEFLHGRFLFDNDKLYAIPPSNIIAKKFDAIVPVLDVTASRTIRMRVQKIWCNATSITEWGKILEKRRSLFPRAG